MNHSDYLSSARKQFEYYKMLGEKTFEQLTEEQLTWQFNPESNSVAIIVKHLWGNMLSRWTDFLVSDGEKTWRDRDAEFQADIHSREELLIKWQEGWDCVFQALDSLTHDDLGKMVYIRNMGHTVVEAINRQLAHYAYHVGQIVYIGKMVKDEAWQSLSIPKGSSRAYNREKFAADRRKGHFTDEYLHKSDPDEKSR